MIVIFELRAGSTPRKEILGNKPYPSSSRILTPGTLLSTRLISSTLCSRISCTSRKAAEPATSFILNFEPIIDTSRIKILSCSSATSIALSSEKAEDENTNTNNAPNPILKTLKFITTSFY